MNPDNTIATAPNTSVWVCGTGPAQAAGQPVTNTLATIYGSCPPSTFFICPPTGQHPYHPNTAATVCTQYGCPPAAAQAAGNQQAYTMHGATVCTQYGCPPQQNANVSVPPHCPTVAPMCPPPAHGGSQAQAQGSYYTQQCGGQPAQMLGGTPQATAQSTGWGITQGIVCYPTGSPTYVCQGNTNAAGAQAFPPSTIGCQPTQQVMGCTTIAGYTHNPPMCPPPPANVGGQAQAQFPTWPIGQCTISPTTGIGATTVITATTIITAAAGGLPQQGQQAQAQGVHPTLTCPAPQGQGPAQVLPHTIFPPQCQPVGGQTGAYTHLFGCTTVTSTPTTPSTHFPGCTGVTSTPATVGHTHLMGCTTVTSTPTTQGPVQGNVQVPNPGGQTGALPPTYHPAGGCGPAANANGGGQAQAQAQLQFPTIPPTVCVATAAFNCGHVTGIPPFC